MTRFEKVAQNPTDMAACIALCIVAYLQKLGIHDFSDRDELVQFMTEIGSDIEEWLIEESED